MKYIISGTNIKQVDKYSIEEIGISSLVLMERAAVAVELHARKLLKKNGRVIIFAGVGNNGGDGIAVARIFLNRGLSTCIYVVGNTEKATEDFATQLKLYKRIGGKVLFIDENDLDKINVQQNDLVIDGIFGVGLSREVTGIYRKVIEIINSLDATVIAIDIPSGVNADTGQIMGLAVRADYTITFNTNRTGMVLYPGCDYAGQIIIEDIGFPNEAIESVERYMELEPEDISFIPKRRNDGNKGTFGKVLVVAGSDSMTGAAYMCSLAAMRMGAGMVKVYTTEKCGNVLRTTIPEVMVDTWNEKEKYIDKLVRAIDWCDIIVVGPGLGQSKPIEYIIECILKKRKRTVIDADGINALAFNDDLKKLLHKDVIITPHIGEMSRFCKSSISCIKKNIIGVTKDISKEYGITVVLKDARSITSDGKNTYINTTGNDGMATAGSGDVLAGIMASIWAISENAENLKEDNSRIAALAHMIHGMAGDRAAQKMTKAGMMATDIIRELKYVLEKAEVKKHE